MYRDSDGETQFQLPPSHPHLAKIRLDAERWYEFHRFDADNPATQFLGHEDPDGGRMTIFVACASDTVRCLLEDAWDA